DDDSQLNDDKQLAQLCSRLSIRLHAANDQQAAMSQELHALSNSDPKAFSPDQIWILVRAINVQSQLLKLYSGDPIHELS
ncbi:MAG: hypothetical protein GTO41_14560, partial [Burkholderiales bacterium]|nr:hypothetical protein [Burkholderiales bacterium]